MSHSLQRIWASSPVLSAMSVGPMRSPAFHHLLQRVFCILFRLSQVGLPGSGLEKCQLFLRSLEVSSCLQESFSSIHEDERGRASFTLYTPSLSWNRKNLSWQDIEAIEELRKFSLVQRNPDTKTLSIYRLVQAVL